MSCRMTDPTVVSVKPLQVSLAIQKLALPTIESRFISSFLLKVSVSSSCLFIFAPLDDELKPVRENKSFPPPSKGFIESTKQRRTSVLYFFADDP